MQAMNMAEAGSFFDTTHNRGVFRSYIAGLHREPLSIQWLAGLRLS
ncbi:hypothetical protein [Tengunoibacter tsumagoiensis]|nr:hypothetical protein [Tengunoibacter tsumagoiensis]